MDVNKFHFHGNNRRIIILPISNVAPAGYSLATTQNSNNSKKLIDEISPHLAKDVNALDHAFVLLSAIGISVAKQKGIISAKLIEAVNNNQLSIYTEDAKTSLYNSDETSSSSGSASSTSDAKQPSVNQSNQGKKSITTSESGSATNNTATEVPIDDQECRSDPISMLSGEEILPLIDFELNGLMPIVWRRLYRSSKIKQNIGLGYGWRHNFSMQLEQKYQEPPKVGPKQPGKYWLELTDEEGRLHIFEKVKRGQTSYQLSSGLALVHQDDGSQTLIKSDDSHWTFTEQVNKPTSLTSSRRKRQEQPQPKWLLQSISNQQGQYIQLAYDEKQRLIELSPGPKRGVKLKYNVDNNIVRIAAYYIDEHDKIHFHDQLLANYQYDDSQALIAATNSSGNVERYSYHKQVVESDSEKAKEASKPLPGYLLKKRTRASGFSHHFEWQGTDENAQCIKQWGDNDTYNYRFNFFKDERGRVSTSTDSNENTETFCHNEQGLLTAFTNANGHTSYNKYDNAGRKVKSIDCEGNVSEFNYNQQGQLSYLIAPDGSVTRYEYNGLGKRILTIDPLGQTNKRIFDGTGRLISETLPDGRSQSYEYTLAGLLGKKTDFSGLVTQYHWDNTGELLAQQIGKTLTRFSYNTLGQLIATVDSQGLITQYTRNEQGQVTQLTSYSQSEPNDKTIQRYAYDDSGRLTRHEFVEATPTNVQESQNHQQNEKIEQTSYEYEGLAQPSRKTFSDGSWLKYQYDKERNLTAIERSDGAIYQLEYSPTEKPTKLIGFDGREQVYTYDANDRLISVADNSERFIRLKRDSLGRIIEQASAGNYKSGARDASVKSAELRNTHNFYQYDKLSRVTRAHNSERTVTQQYHQNGEISTSQQGAWQLDYTYDDKGQRQTLELPDNSKLHYSYNEQGQLSGIAYQQSEQNSKNAKNPKNANGSQSLITQEYNASGLLIQQNLGNGIELTQKFDVFSRLAEQQWHTRHITEQTKNTQKTFSELRTYQYDNKHQLINVSSLNKSINTNAYSNNPNTNNQNTNNKDTDNTEINSKAFSYNSINQLLQTKLTTESSIPLVEENATQEIEQTTEQYQWDAFGNPVSLHAEENNFTESLNTANVDQNNENIHSQNEQNLATNNLVRPRQSKDNIIVKNDRLLSFLGTDYRYDGSGNQLSSLAQGEKQQRSFNGLNQLKSININSQLTHYEYDALGRRSAKITEQGRIDFIWDENQLIGEHHKGQFTWYIYQPNSFKPIALIKSATGSKNSEIYYYHLDQLRTPLYLTNSEAKQVWRNESDAFGYQKNNQHPDKKENISNAKNIISNPLRFQGQYFDEESNLHYNRFRYYCPKQQRFIHQDPIGLVGGINHYQYAPNPVNWVDPFGLVMCKDGEKSLKEALATNVESGCISPKLSDKLLEAAQAGQLTPKEIKDHLSSLPQEEGLQPVMVLPIEWMIEGLADAATSLAEMIETGPSLAGTAAVAIALIPGKVADKVLEPVVKRLEVSKINTVTPESLNVRSIAQNDKLISMWTDSLKHLYSAQTKGGAKYRAYLEAMSSGNVSKDVARSAYEEVAVQFRNKIKRAKANGETFDEYDFERIHHWNWPIGEFPEDATNAKKLFPVSHDKHMEIHRAATVGPHPTKNPINPTNVMDEPSQSLLPSNYFKQE
ncbi:RHS repeat-associated core domain-containing protein [Pseudocolwellia sp. HL-MZ19]|uniref:RHS repeat-associated core domain-containing protein n=1 Tax=Pseudocolwellia sp. HL-MZ19 TaxID=3400846 RepID=UPI003CE6A395